MPDAIETREVVVRYRDEGVVAGYNAATAAGNRAAAATHAVGSAMGSTMSLVDRAAASVGKFGQKAATELSQVHRAAVTSTSALGAFTGGVAAMGGQIARQKGGVKLALELNAAGDAAIFARAAAGRYTGGLKELQQAEEGAAKAAEHQARAQHEASSSRGGMAGFGAGAMLTGGSVGQKLGSIATMLPMAVAGGPAALAGAAVAAGGAIAMAIGQVAVGSVKLLAAEIVFGTRLLLGMGAAATAVGAAFGYAALNAALQRDTMMRGLTAVLGSKDAAQSELVVLREIAKMPGINLENALKSAVQMRAVGVEISQVNRLLKEMANLNAIISGKPEQLGLAMVQMMQMAGRGKVTGEELRALANDLPPLMGVFKEAFGTTSGEDIEKMGLSFEAVMARLIAVMERGPRATTGFMNALENIKDVWKELLVAFGMPIATAATPVIDALAKGIALLTPYVEALANTIAARIPEVAKYLNEAITPETVQNFVRRLLEMGVNVEYWAKSMLGSGADLVEGMGMLLGTILGSFTDFQAALNTVAIGTLTVVAGMATAVARMMGATAGHIAEIRAAAADPSKRSWWSGTSGRSAEDLSAWANRLESLRNGALAAQVSVSALGRVLDQGLAAARGSGIDQLGHKIADASHRAADAIRRQAGTTAQLDEWYRKAVLSARGFTLAQQEQAKALDPATRAIDEQAQAFARLAKGLTAATDHAKELARERARLAQQSAETLQGMAPGMWQTAQGAANPSRAFEAMKPFEQMKTGIQWMKDALEGLKRMPDKERPAMLVEWYTDAIKRAEEQLKSLQEGYDTQKKSILEVVDAMRKQTEASKALMTAEWKLATARGDTSRIAAIEDQWRRVAAQENAMETARMRGMFGQVEAMEAYTRAMQENVKWLDAATQAQGKVNAERAGLLGAGLAGGGSKILDALNSIGKVNEWIREARREGRTIDQTSVNEAVKAAYSTLLAAGVTFSDNGVATVPPWVMRAIEESQKDPRRLFIENNADKATRQEAPDLAAQVFGNLGLGDAELMVQAQLDQQAQFKDAIFGAAQTAGESLVDTLAQALGVILPREVALQLADQLNRSLEAAH